MHQIRPEAIPADTGYVPETVTGTKAGRQPLGPEVQPRYRKGSQANATATGTGVENNIINKMNR